MGITTIQPRLLKIPEAALMLGLGRSKLYELIQRESIKVVRIDRAVRIPASEVDRFLAERYALSGIETGAPDRAA